MLERRPTPSWNFYLHLLKDYNMENKYLEKLSAVIPNFKQFGGLRGTIEAARRNTEDAGRFAHDAFKDKRIAEAAAEKAMARKELGKGVAIATVGTAAAGLAAKKALEKKAGYNVNTNYNYNRDPKRDARMYAAEEGNDVLVRRGYVPAITESAPDFAKAEMLSKLDWEAERRPNEVTANRWGTAAGIGTGAAVYGALSAAHVNPILAAIAAASSGLVGGVGTKALLYKDPIKRMEDDQYADKHTNLLLEHLSNNYEKQASVEENKYLTHLVKQAGPWGSVVGAVKNFAAGAVTDAGKLGGQLKAVGAAASHDANALKHGPMLPTGGPTMPSRVGVGRSLGDLAKNKAVHVGAGVLGTGYVAGKMSN